MTTSPWSRQRLDVVELALGLWFKVCFASVSIIWALRIRGQLDRSRSSTNGAIKISTSSVDERFGGDKTSDRGRFLYIRYTKAVLGVP